MKTPQVQLQVPREGNPRPSQGKDAGEEFSIVIELDEALLRKVAGGRKYIKIDW